MTIENDSTHDAGAMATSVARLRCRLFRNPSLLLALVSLIYVWQVIRMPSQTNPSSYGAATFDLRLRDSFQHSSTSTSPPVPETSRLKSDPTFSACLLVMDDNHFLIEWLAYHYFVLPLRRLVVAVDPRSQTSPQRILNRWHSYGMDITMWNDHDYMTADEKHGAEAHVQKQFSPDILDQPDLIVHRARQRLFYYKCMKQLKQEGRDWVTLIDSDEFLHVNYPTVRALDNHVTAPAMDQHGSVVTFLQSELDRPGNNISKPCIQIPRIRYGAKETASEKLDQVIGDPASSSFNHSLFQTLRWRKHASPDNYPLNRISKTVIDLSRVEWTDLQPVDSIHRPIRSLCGHRRLHIRSKDQVFLINHYLGTWAQYSYRQDSRTGKERSRQTYDRSRQLDEGSDDTVLPWLQGFIDKVGLPTARKLLDGVGALE